MDYNEKMVFDGTRTQFVIATIPILKYIDCLWHLYDYLHKWLSNDWSIGPIWLLRKPTLRAFISARISRIKSDAARAWLRAACCFPYVNDCEICGANYDLFRMFNGVASMYWPKQKLSTGNAQCFIVNMYLPWNEFARLLTNGGTLIIPFRSHVCRWILRMAESCVPSLPPVCNEYVFVSPISVDQMLPNNRMCIWNAYDYKAFQIWWYMRRCCHNNFISKPYFQHNTLRWLSATMTSYVVVSVSRTRHTYLLTILRRFPSHQINY